MNRIWIAALVISTFLTEALYAQDWVNFTVTRHVNATLTAAQVDDALDTINTRMQLNNHDCADDTPCTARFRRSGAVGTFGTAGDGLDIITTASELNDVFAITTHRAKVVIFLDYCDGRYNPSFIGCGTCNGFGYIVEDGVSGHVYVHEYGHNVLGCGHRDDCPENIMNTYSIGTNNSVNASECTGFGGQAYTMRGGIVYDGVGGPLTVADGPYWFIDNVTVPVGEVLTIEAGVEIQWEPGVQITSHGTTTGDGGATTIIIYSNNEAADFPTATVNGQLQIRNGGILLLR